MLANFINGHFGNSVRYNADVAGGQGMLYRILNKKYNYQCEVVDPRGWTLKGITSRETEMDSSLAEFFDLIIGLHPDEATRSVAEAALKRPAVLVPCCNSWSEEKLEQQELLEAIEHFYSENQVNFERVVFRFNGPKNIGLVSEPPGV